MAFDIRLLKSALRRFLSKINSFTHIISFIISSLFKKLRIRHSNDTAFLLSLYALFCDHLLESFLKISPPFNRVAPSFQRALFQLKIVANKADKWIPRQFFLGIFFSQQIQFFTFLREQDCSDKVQTFDLVGQRKLNRVQKTSSCFSMNVQIMAFLASSCD